MKGGIAINNCWVACCDLLGFSDQVERYTAANLDIFVNHFYEPVRTEAQALAERHPDCVFVTSGSDSFCFYTRDDSVQTFIFLHGEVADFCRFLTGMWPFRAAIGFGPLYADASKNIFLGSGMIDAHRYTEGERKPNWIGLTVTQSASKRLSGLGVDLSRWRVAFSRYAVPTSGHNGTDKVSDGELFAARIHHQAPYIKRAVEVMQREAPDRYKEKAENTLKFFQSCP